jgi:hypothetical protein
MRTQNSKLPRPWAVCIMKNKRRLFCGFYSNLPEAKEAYNLHVLQMSDDYNVLYADAITPSVQQLLDQRGDTLLIMTPTN